MEMKSLLVLSLVVCAAATQAAVIPLVNGGFEEPWADYSYTSVDTGLGGEVAPGWTVSQGLAFGGVAYADWATEGYQAFWIQTNDGINEMPYDLGYTEQAIRQITSTTAVEGVEYTLRYDYTGGWGWGWLKEITASLLIGDVIVSSDTHYDVESGVGWFTFGTEGYVASAADAGKAIGIEFYFNNLNNNYWHATSYIDNVVLTAVPEPASLVILGFGALTLLRKRS